jgi:RHS repeat-associated protein
VDGAIGHPDAKKYWYVTDHLGSVRAVTDIDGKKVWSADYLAFGTQYGKDAATDFEELHSFTGKELDPDTGLHYYNARWYDAELGRFISEDPAGDPNNPNLYSYCRNNPLIYIDPTGYISQEDAMAEHEAKSTDGGTDTGFPTGGSPGSSQGEQSESCENGRGAIQAVDEDDIPWTETEEKYFDGNKEITIITREKKVGNITITEQDVYVLEINKDYNPEIGKGYPFSRSSYSLPTIVTVNNPTENVTTNCNTPVVSIDNGSKSPSKQQEPPPKSEPIDTTPSPVNVGRVGSGNGSNGKGSGGGGFGGAISSVVTAEVQHIFESIGKITKPVHTVFDGTIHLWSKPVCKWATKVASGIAYASCFYAGFQIGRDPNLTLGQKWAKAGIEGLGAAIEITVGVGVGLAVAPFTGGLGGFFIGAGAAAATSFGVSVAKDWAYSKLNL